EHVVLAIVLVLNHELHGGQPFAEAGDSGHASNTAAIGVAAPCAIGVAQVGIRGPVAAVDQRLQSCAVRAGFGAEHAPTSLRACHRSIGAAVDEGLCVFENTSANEIIVLAFLQLRDGLHRCIE